MRRDPLLFVLAVSGVGLGVASLLPGREAQAGPPQLVQYQGRVVDSNGVPLEGTVNTLTFRLYSTAAATSASFVWGERHLAVPVRRGVFTVYLGSGQQIDASNNPVVPPQQLGGKFDGADRYVQVQVENDAPLAPLAPIGSVPYALTAGGSVPVGSIVDWYRPTPATLVPSGWALCNGDLVADPESPMNGQPTPNLINRFVRGLDPALMTPTSYGAGAASPLPDAGGADSLALGHGHTTQPHSHGHNHTHSITQDPGHSHPGSFLGDAAGHLTSPFVSDGGARFAFLGPGPNCQHAVPVQVSSGGAHNHGGGTGGPSNTQTDFSGVGVDTALGNVDNRPVYVGLLKIIRVK